MQSTNEKSSYLISFITKKQEYKLPNVSINNIHELETFYEKYSHINNPKYVELWFFKKARNRDSNSLIGRIAISNRQVYNNISELENEQVIEQIWSANHRNIESYNEQLGYGFLSASRTSWGRKYKINKIKTPPDTSLSTEMMLSQFYQVAKEIEGKRENIEKFSKYLQSLDIKSFNLEYMLRDGKFSFIDWDSENDLKVVNSLIKNKELER